MLDSVDSPTRDGNANHMFEVAFREALIKLLIHDCFHTRIDFDISVFLIDQLDALLDINIDTLVDESLRVGVLVANVESVARL